MSTVGNRLIWRYCVVSEIETTFNVFSIFFFSEILVQKIWESIANCHFHTEMRRLVQRKYMAAPQICGFVIAKDMTIFNSVVQMNPPSISAYAVSMFLPNNNKTGRNKLK